MRRMLGLGLVLLLLAAPSLASAQTFPAGAPGGTIIWSGASISCTNTAGECSMFQYTLPAAFIATSSTVGAVVSPYLIGATSDGRLSPVLWTVPQPLHLSMIGTVSGAAATIFQTGVNFGGTAASVGISNTIATPINQQPIQLDVYITPIASSSATPNQTNNVFLVAKVTLMSTTGGVATVTSSSTLAGMNLASPTQLNVLNRWQAASGGSSVIWYRRVLKVGE